MNRRNLLKAGLGSTTVSLIPNLILNSWGGNLRSNGSLDESMSSLVKHGNIKSDHKFVWSIMTVAQPDNFSNRIAEIRELHRYKNEFKYSSTDKFKVEPAKGIIDLIDEYSGSINFSLVLFNSSPSNFNNVSPVNFQTRLSSLYSEILMNHTGGNLISKVEDRFGPSDSYNENFINAHGIENLGINAKMNEIIQVNDLISGIIFSIFAEVNISSEAKIKTVNYFKTKFTFPDSFGSDSYNNGSFTLRKINITF